MHFRPFSVKKKNSDFSDFFPISPIVEIFWPIFLTIFLILGFPPSWNPRFPTGPPLSFYIKNLEQNQISDADPQKRISDS